MKVVVARRGADGLVKNGINR